MKRWLFIFLMPCILSSFSGYHFGEKVVVNPDESCKIKFPIYSNNSLLWADSVLSTMSLEEKIGQLFMVSAYPERDKKHYDELFELVTKYKIGGVIFFKSGPKQLVNLENSLQTLSKIPLLMSIDGEWGLSMRVDSTMRFPLQMQLGAISNKDLIYKMGKTIGNQMKRMGIQINFAPVLDVNNNPLNPVINMRSFGDNKKEVVEKSYQYMKGQQEMNVLAVGKHFPGHGDTKTDSHSDLPYIGFSKKRLDSLELYPFKQIINKGIGGIMVGHLDVPALDPQHRGPSSLSKNIVTDLLRNKMQFDGLIFTDGLNMKGITKFFKPGEAALKALLAGNDILLCAEDVPWGVRLIKEAVEDSVLCEQEIDEHVKRILQVKYWTGLNKCQLVDTTNLINDLHSAKDELLNRKLTENSLTLVKNQNNLIPLKRLDTLKIASLFFGKTDTNYFQESISLYAKISKFNITKDLSNAELQKLKDTLKNYNLIIISLKQTNRYSYRTFNFTDQSLEILKSVSDSNNVILNLFASPYSLNKVANFKKIKAIIVGYDDTKNPAELTPQLIFGGINAVGHLPVNVSDEYKFGCGIETNEQNRLKYSIPEEVNICSKNLNKIDTLINNAINLKAFPGCQVLVVKDGIVFYNKAFGNLTYEMPEKVNVNTIYDLASVTKTLSTTLLLMHLYDNNKFDYNKKLSYYLKDISGTNKEDINIKDILTHQAKLQPFLPFYKKLISEQNKSKYLTNVITNNYKIVADSSYVINSIDDSIYKQILESKLLPEKEYKYSDLGFYFMQYVIKKITHQNLDILADSLFYKKIGATTLGYNPLKKFSKKNIAPTENDKEFRKQIIRGYVHDPGAALLNGVAGHAGLFSNANDVAKICQMLLWNGVYGEEKYIEKSTISEFTSCQFCPENRRGLGFDKPETNNKKESPVSKYVSEQTYGHQGFTGTCYWVDPKHNLVYVFLSNRVYPDAENKKINQLGIRNKILDIVYQEIEK